MSNLKAFLNPSYTEKTIEVIVSDRFVGDDGKPVPFILKSLKQEVIQEIAKRSTHQKKIGKRNVDQIDKTEHMCRCIITSCVQPNFNDRELCLAYGTEDPVALPLKMLFVGEFDKLTTAFMELHGMSDEEDEEETLGEVSKN